MSEALKILVVDDHPIFCDGMRDMLQDIYPDASILQAEDGAAALTLVKQNKNLDWVFLDMMLPDKTGTEMLHEFTSANLWAPVVVVSSEDNPEIIHAALNAGANAYISKSSKKSVFIECMQQVENGLQFLQPEIEFSLQHYRDVELVKRDYLHKEISKRQHEVLQLLAQGFSNAEIGNELSLSVSTIKSHLSALMDVLQADNRTHCVSKAREQGMLI
ncbi:MAG: response regulator transcription factor [Gammaproteobacteria bacterium]|nr:response regulator transcription factor [Gammaproteobacteria bacterium]